MARSQSLGGADPARERAATGFLPVFSRRPGKRDIIPRWCFDNPTAETSMRPSGRAPEAMRPVTLDPGVAKYAEGSCLAKFGDTQVLCTASVEERVPPFLRNTGKGWVTAEYGMLPRSTATRTDREATRGRQSGRTQEIQRLIGRSLRAVIDLPRLGERQIRIDCDVLQADGGTRTAAVTGSYVALHQACQRLVSTGLLTGLPLRDSVAAISCGVIAGSAVLDLDYAEDSQAETDANFVLTGTGGIVEIQATAEGAPFDEPLFAEMLRLARSGIAELTRHQRATLGLG
jgi:ribonuclease PH